MPRPKKKSEQEYYSLFIEDKTELYIKLRDEQKFYQNDENKFIVNFSEMSRKESKAVLQFFEYIKQYKLHRDRYSKIKAIDEIKLLKR